MCYRKVAAILSLLIMCIFSSCDSALEPKNIDVFALDHLTGKNPDERKSNYALYTIGEIPLEDSPVEMIRVFISQPFGGNNYVVKFSKFSDHMRFCRKEIKGVGLLKDYNETCRSSPLDSNLDSLWKILVREVLDQTALDVNTGNDDFSARVELAEGLNNNIIETKICGNNSWAVLLAETILKEKLELELPPCKLNIIPQ